MALLGGMSGGKGTARYAGLSNPPGTDPIRFAGSGHVAEWPVPASQAQSRPACAAYATAAAREGSRSFVRTLAT